MAVKFRDYYEILGVKRDADDKEIHRAFRKLARKYHPDVNPGDSKAEDKFKEINEAYEVLRDPDKRRKYDTLGANWKAGQDFTPPSGWEQFHFDFGGADNSQGTFFEGMGGDFSDFFNSLFGNFGGRRSSTSARQQTWAQRGHDVQAEITITLEEAFHGVTKSISLQRQENCTSCSGKGLRGNRPCPACKGSGISSTVRNYEVKIPGNIQNGGKIRLAGQGGEGSGGGLPGDLFIRIHIAPHPKFKLDGSDVSITLALTPWEAALGTKVEVPTLEGNATLTIPEGIQSGQRLRMKEKGLLKKQGNRGDQYVEIRINVPKQLTNKERELFEELAKASSFNPRKM